MRKYTKSLVALLLAIALLISTYTPIFAVGTYVVDVPVSTSAAQTYPTTYSKNYNSGYRDQVCTALSAGAATYYTGSYSIETLMSQSGSTLENTLRTLMRNTHSTTTSYGNCRDYADKTDCEGKTDATGNSSRQITMLYTGYQATYSQYNSGSGWNREHVWPQSLGGGDTSGGGADLHHIRPDENKTNGDRGNLKYGNLSSGTTSKGNLSGMVGGTKGSYFEPNDNVKGDVARIILYVYVRWYTSWGADSVTEVFQSVDVLLEWCALDPVDTWEMGRNEVVQNIQGNRNVFIDYPELAWKMFNKTVPANLQTPTSSGSSSADPSCQHTSTTVKNQIVATCGVAGYTGDTYCNSCNGKISSGTTIPATGNHNFGAWVENNSTNTHTRTCGTCGKTETESIACKHTVTSIKNQTSATCGVAGYTGDTYCVICQVTLGAGQTIDATGDHTYNSWSVDVDSNTKTRSCYICGYVDSASAELENCTHSVTMKKNYVEVTCGTDGYTGDKCCTRCNQVIEKGRTIAATGNHTYGEVAVVVQPTIVEDGEGKQICSVCYDEIIVVIPALSVSGDLTVEQLASALGSDAEKILLLLAMGLVDRTLVDGLT